MSQETLHYYKTPPPFTARDNASDMAGESSAKARLEPATCTEAEPFALQVLDDSMEPEFNSGCVILIDPTGRATDGSFVLAEDSDGQYLFRQLRQSAAGKWALHALNQAYPSAATADDLSALEGVIVQRSGVRRGYHKSYA